MTQRVLRSCQGFLLFHHHLLLRRPRSLHMNIPQATSNRSKQIHLPCCLRLCINRPPDLSFPEACRRLYQMIRPQDAGRAAQQSFAGLTRSSMAIVGDDHKKSLSCHRRRHHPLRRLCSGSCSTWRNHHHLLPRLSLICDAPREVPWALA
jgi:hypothetical protein